MLGVKLWGGLGNQMFLYAFARYLESQRNEPVNFYTIPFHPDYSGGLQKFRTRLSFLPQDAISRYYILPPNVYSYRLERKVIQKLPFLNRQVFVENSLQHKLSFPLEAMLFDGYFQYWRYAESHSDFLRHEFQLKEEILAELPGTDDDISNPCSVSVHIRRGDYLSRENRKLFAACNEAYYRKAFETIAHKVKNPVFLFFSNDTDWLRNNKEKFTGLNYRIIDDSGNRNSDVSDLMLMSRCSHNIIANSTFSWWGAWLNNNPDKIVVAPAAWYRGKLNETTVDLIPPEWIRV